MKAVALYVGIFVIVLVCFLIIGGIAELAEYAWNTLVPEGVTMALSCLFILGLVGLISLCVFGELTDDDLDV